MRESVTPKSCVRPPTFPISETNPFSAVERAIPIVLQVGRERACDLDARARDGVWKRDARGVQRVAGKSIARAAAIDFVAGHRKSDKREMRPDLMLAPGHGTARDEPGRSSSRDEGHMRDRFSRRHLIARGDHLAAEGTVGTCHVLIARDRDVDRDSFADAPRRFGAHDRRVSFLDEPTRKGPLEDARRIDAAGNDHAAGRFAVEAVRDLKRLTRESSDERVDERSRLESAARVHREERRLVDDEERRILIEDAERHRRVGLGERLDVNRDATPGVDARVGFGVAFVERDVAIDDEAVNSRSRRAAKSGGEKMVDARAVPLGWYNEGNDSRHPAVI